MTLQDAANWLRRVHCSKCAKDKRRGDCSECDRLAAERLRIIIETGVEPRGSANEQQQPSED